MSKLPPLASIIDYRHGLNANSRTLAKKDPERIKSGVYHPTKNRKMPSMKRAVAAEITRMMKSGHRFSMKNIKNSLEKEAILP